MLVARGASAGRGLDKSPIAGMTLRFARAGRDRKTCSADGGQDTAQHADHDGPEETRAHQTWRDREGKDNLTERLPVQCRRLVAIEQGPGRERTDRSANQCEKSGLD